MQNIMTNIMITLIRNKTMTSRLTAVLLTCSILINAYLILQTPVRTVKIRNIVSLDEKNSDFLQKKFEPDKLRKPQNKPEVVKAAEPDEDNLGFEVKQPKVPVEAPAPVKKVNKKADKKVNKKTVTGNTVCPEISIWTNHLVKPKQATNLKDWGFNTQRECPKFTVDKHPVVRPKINLHCDGKDSKIVTSTTTSPRDVTQVEFGNQCLADVIDNCCKGKQAVPNVVHYIWYADKELGYFQFISFMSALRFVKPCLIIIHGMFIPKGKYWNYFVSISPNIIHVVREKPTSVFGHKLAFEEHASDIMRIEALKFYGGIYLDFDEIVLRPLEPLRKFDYTQGRERDVTMGSQLVMAKKNATFLNYWYKSYRDDYKKEWAWNALWVPEKLSKKYPKLIHVEGYNFTRPNWQHTDLIYKKNYDWSTNYGMHLYVRWYKNETNNVIIRTLNTTIGSVCRHVLFGNKELCVH